MNKSVIALGALALILIALTSPALASVQLDKVIYYFGDTVTATGKVTPNATVIVSLVRPDGSTVPLDQVTADPDGSITYKLELPSEPNSVFPYAGAYKLVFKYDDVREEAAFIVQEKPQLQTSSESTSGGVVVQYTGLQTYEANQQQIQIIVSNVDLRTGEITLGLQGSPGVYQVVVQTATGTKVYSQRVLIPATIHVSVPVITEYGFRTINVIVTVTDENGVVVGSATIYTRIYAPKPKVTITGFHVEKDKGIVNIDVVTAISTSVVIKVGDVDVITDTIKEPKTYKVPVPLGKPVDLKVIAKTQYDETEYDCVVLLTPNATGAQPQQVVSKPMVTKLEAVPPRLSVTVVCPKQQKCEILVNGRLVLSTQVAGTRVLTAPNALAGNPPYNVLVKIGNTQYSFILGAGATGGGGGKPQQQQQTQTVITATPVGVAQPNMAAVGALVAVIAGSALLIIVRRRRGIGT